jgi:hypothetical protein
MHCTYIGSYGRGIIEIIGLGILILPVDIIITIKRYNKIKKNLK